MSYKSFQKGFLLADVMIAVFITTSALVAIMAAMSPSLKTEFFKRDEIIATGLAQEGIELIRNIRDNNWKTCTDHAAGPCIRPRVPMSAFLAPFPASNTTVCPSYDYKYNDLPTTPLLPCSATTGYRYLKPDPITGVYATTDAATGAKFMRTITIQSPTGITRKVISTVTWGTGAAAHTVTLTDILTDWGNK